MTDAPPMEPPAFVLNAALPDLVGCWLEVRCCKGMVLIPFRMLVEAKPARRHSGNGYLSPIAYEAQMIKETEAR